jgi:alcohol dehydrogenase
MPRQSRVEEQKVVTDEIRDFYSPTHLIFGRGAAVRTGPEAKRLGAKRVFVVTDRRVEAAGLTERPLQSLRDAGLDCVVFADCEPDPPIATVEAALERYRAEDCDVIVVVGGGSAICLGRAVALRATNPEKSLRDMEGMNRFVAPPKPTVLVTTTTGSGSEVSPVFIITDPERVVKMNIGGRGAQATVSILDPELLRSLSPEQVLATGMDAITHALESFLSNRASVITDALAIRSLKLLWTHIAPAAFSVNNMESRGQMLVASIMSVQASGSARLGLVHAMSDQISAFHHVSHGISNALMLPTVMEYNLPVALDKFAELAQATGARRNGGADAPEAFLEAIARLYRHLGLPRRLPQSVDPASFEDWADRTLENPLFATTIRKPTKAEAVELYRRAWAGPEWLS